ncbi:MAG: crossover junction endodeoxyribonuclease RuvC, partial [Chloroflexi bacterium]|nr:crossover junction endodeoxyribonuclease RuvC [Chloroflexota bacterium]
MLVIGIDPGTAATGYGLVRDTEEGLAAVAYGVVSTPAGLEMPARLKMLFHQLTGLLR